MNEINCLLLQYCWININSWDMLFYLFCVPYIPKLCYTIMHQEIHIEYGSPIGYKTRGLGQFFKNPLSWLVDALSVLLLLKPESYNKNFSRFIRLKLGVVYGFASLVWTSTTNGSFTKRRFMRARSTMHTENKQTA